MLKAFQTFDQAKEGMIETFKVGTILKAMNVPFDKDELARTIEAYNPESNIYVLSNILSVFNSFKIDKIFKFFSNDTSESVKINFDTFAAIASSFLEEEDDEAMQNELREAFRMYDKEGII